ncbi:hypothetical protein JTE90_027172 [Oedothorax gibbosus]|uniref:Uncharacterized protein n=1 Tax=Oedothorax gibbosus TaxID=931172 RepID=A0AAV6TJ22_9ARAC|nr:hypothetical protein JTE90_027172 [Oedothorax gibbosus]
MDYTGEVSGDKRVECESMNLLSSGAQEFRPKTWEFPSFVTFGRLGSPDAMRDLIPRIKSPFRRGIASSIFLL